jgi:hypothetical protein
MVQSQFLECTVVQNPKNKGFAVANNQGLRIAKGRYVLFLNPDTVLQTDALTSMCRFLDKNSSFGAVGCKLCNLDGSVQYACARTFPTPVNQLFYLLMFYRIFPTIRTFSTTELHHWDHLDSRAVDCLCGACIMATRSILTELGGFNENFFMYAEDVELCYRIKEAGLKIYYLADQQILHLSGSSSSQRKEAFFSAIMNRESNCKFIELHYGRSKAQQFRTCVAIGSFIRLLVVFPISIFGVIAGINQLRFSRQIFKKYLTLFLWAVNVIDTSNIQGS